MQLNLEEKRINKAFFSFNVILQVLHKFNTVLVKLQEKTLNKVFVWFKIDQQKLCKEFDKANVKNIS